MKAYTQMHWTPEMVSRFWDYHSQFSTQYFSYRFGREIIWKLLPLLPKQGNLLDYGCGPGNLIEHLLESSLSVWGLDSSPDSVKLTNERFEGKSNYGGAFTLDQTPDKVGFFDAILSVEVVEHLYDEQLDALLSNMKKLLKPGGYAVFTTPNEEILENSEMLCPSTGEVFHKRQHVRSWSADTLSDYLTSHGLHVVKALPSDFSLTMRTSHTARPVNQLYKNLKKSIKYQLQPDKKKPHLIVIAKTES